MNSLHWTRLLLAGLPLAVACAGADPDQGSQTDGDYASARIAITQAPADVLCISITAQGSRTVQQSFDVMPGQSTVLPMNRLPTGLVTSSR